MRVFITGGAGFIGSHLVDRLLEIGCEVRVLDVVDPQVHTDGGPKHLNKDAEFIRGDIRDPEVVRRALRGVDRLVHLAAAVGVGQSMYQIAHYTSVNAFGTAVMLEEALSVRGKLEKVVVASSMSIYGEGLYRCPEEGVDLAARERPQAQLLARDWEPRCPACGAALTPLPTPETKPLLPASIYAIGKRDHEEMVLVWGRAYGVPATALRFFNVYGPRQALSNPYTGVAAIFASRLLNGRPPIIFEDGRQTRDFVHVHDVVSGVIAALDLPSAAGEPLNIGTGKPITVLDVAAALTHALDVKIEPEVRNVFRAGDIRHCVADVKRAKEVLGYQPSVDFVEGMRDLAVWLANEDAADLVEQAADQLTQRGLTV
jgi:dTDP-L-rhamnose 4-epimerase